MLELDSWRLLLIEKRLNAPDASASGTLAERAPKKDSRERMEWRGEDASRVARSRVRTASSNAVAMTQCRFGTWTA